MNFRKPNAPRRTTITILLIMAISAFLTNIYAQDNNKLVKANNLYKAKRYAEAIPIYEDLLENNFNKSVLLKLGKSHRQINNIAEALEKYHLLMQQPEVKPDHQLDFVELLIMNGDYKEAQKSLKKIPSIDGTIDKIFGLTTMINNNYNLKPVYDSVQLESFMYNTTESDENSPFFLENKLIFTSDQSQKSNIKKKSGLTGRAYYKVWEAEMDDSVFSSPKEIGNAINATNKNTANAFFNLEHQEVYFTKNDNKKDRKDFYNMQLYRSEMKNGKFGKADKISVNSSQYNYMHPCLSSDGNILLYVSDRPGEGGTDIYISRRTKEGWSRGKNIGEVINTTANEGFPFLDDQGDLYFCSKGHSGLGGYDIFVAKKNRKGTWDAPINLGRPFNSQYDDISIFFKKEGKKGAFTSARNGSDDIFLFEILP